MSTEEVQETTSQTQAVADWEPTMPPTDLIFDDGNPWKVIATGLP